MPTSLQAQGHVLRSCKPNNILLGQQRDINADPHTAMKVQMADYGAGLQLGTAGLPKLIRRRWETPRTCICKQAFTLARSSVP